MEKTRAVVIVPTWNERGTIAQVLETLLAQQERLPQFELNVVVVDGLSNDGTIEYVSSLLHDEPRLHLLTIEERGLGIALQHAHRYAFEDLCAGVVAQIDADLSHEPTQLPELLHSLVNGYDLAIGSRYVAGGGTSGWPVSRRLTSLLANRLIRIITGCGDVHDWTSGFRAFTIDIYRRIGPDNVAYRDYTLQPALVYGAVLAGARVKEVPIMFANRRWGKSKLPLAGYSFNLLRHFLRARFRRPPRVPAPWPTRITD